MKNGFSQVACYFGNGWERRKNIMKQVYGELDLDTGGKKAIIC